MSSVNLIVKTHRSLIFHKFLQGINGNLKKNFSIYKTIFLFIHQKYLDKINKLFIHKLCIKTTTTCQMEFAYIKVYFFHRVIIHSLLQRMT